MIDEQRSPEDEVEGTDDEPHFLADPEVAGAFDQILEEFARETDRGSILIAADIVSAHLEKIITQLAPAGFTPKRLRSLLAYPGTLASFSARADVAHLAGFIGETAHRSIDLLRKLRNQAAHSQGAFSLRSHRDALRSICDLGPGTATAVNRFALELMMQSAIKNAMASGLELEAEIGRNPFASPGDVIDYLAERPDLTASMEERLPRMELAFGVWLLIGLMHHQKKALLAKRTPAAAPVET